MNCFHFSVSLGYKTTYIFGYEEDILLWIAFIFQYLWDTKQRDAVSRFASSCCELLSFFSIFGIQNNTLPVVAFAVKVVNCFHFSVSLGYKTTRVWIHRSKRSLWIAFIFQYLWDTKQQNNQHYNYQMCCELLSFFSIFGIQNNRHRWTERLSWVVNCFHFSVSLGYKTTKANLWI